MYEVHEQGFFVCEEHCGRRFKSQRYLSDHLKRVAEKDRRKRQRLFICSEKSQAEIPYGRSITPPSHETKRQAEDGGAELSESSDDSADVKPQDLDFIVSDNKLE